MTHQINQKTMKRLLAYSAAAGLGAFAFGQAAEGAVIFADLTDPITLAPLTIGPDEFRDFDFNVDGYLDLTISNEAGGNRIRFIPGTGVDNKVFTDWTGSPSGYYVQSFVAGTTISGALPAASSNYDFLGARREVGPPEVHYNHIGTGKLVGFQFPGAFGAIHFGWLQVDVKFMSPGEVLLFSYAYETQPGVPIVAGDTDGDGIADIPEPTTLGLLAIGAGGLALRRRRSA